MRNLKMLGMLAAVALIALVGTASATTLTSPEGVTYTGAFKATSSAITTHGPWWSINCWSSSMEGNVESHGASVPGVVKLSDLNFSTCNWITETKKTGVLEIHSNGVVTSTGAEVVFFTPWMEGTFECKYITKNTELGTVLGSNSAHADIELESATLLRSGFSLACPNTVVMTGTYTITTPSTLLVD